MRTLHTLILPFALTLICLIFSCTDSGENNGLPQFIQVGEPSRSYDNVDQRLWIYFERFEAAAAARNINADLEDFGVTGSIETNPGHNAPGACSENTNNTLHHVSLRQDFWVDASVTEREIIVFHELGHCFLGRGHVNLALPDGTCASLMRSGGNVCIDNYFVQTRDFYLDELFGT